MGEVISPGSWSHSSCCLLGQVDHPMASEATMRILLGKNTISPECKQQLGNYAKYLSKGNKLPRSLMENSIPFRHMNDWQRPDAPPYPVPQKIHCKPTLEMFHIYPGTSSKQESQVSLKLLTRIKQENRRRFSNALLQFVKKASKKGDNSLSKIQVKVKLCDMPSGIAPNS